MARRNESETPNEAETVLDCEDFIGFPVPTGDYLSEKEAMYQLWREDEHGEPPSGADLRNNFWEISDGCYLSRPYR